MNWRKEYAKIHSLRGFTVEVNQLKLDPEKEQKCQKQLSISNMCPSFDPSSIRQVEQLKSKRVAVLLEKGYLFVINAQNMSEAFEIIQKVASDIDNTPSMFNKTTLILGQFYVFPHKVNQICSMN